MASDKPGKRRETPEEKLHRLTESERGLWAEGLTVAGIDEVGRGPLAGPVVTACVSIPQARLVMGVDDSKKLSEKRREALYPLLLEAACKGRGWLLSGGRYDIDRAAALVLDEFRGGKIGRITIEEA